MWKLYELQPLRIPAGWTVRYNNFTEYDPDMDGPDDSLNELNEDLLQLENGNLFIDLGWYPARDAEGSYALYFIDKNRDRPYEKPLEVFESRSKKDIIKKLEYWTDRNHFQQFL